MVWLISLDRPLILIVQKGIKMNQETAIDILIKIALEALTTDTPNELQL